MVNYVMVCSRLLFFSIEILALTYLGAVISAIFSKFPKIKPDRGILLATAYSILMPSCLCSGYPIILSTSKTFLRIYIAILTPLLSPQIVLFGLNFIGVEYVMTRAVLSIILSLALAGIITNSGGAKITPFATYHLDPSQPQSIIAKANQLFRLSLAPVLIALGVALIMEFLFSKYNLGKALLFPSQRLLALFVAGGLKFCAGQEVIILSALKGLPVGMGFFLGFSLMASGICLSMLPIYLKIYTPKGLVIYITGLITTSIILAVY